MNQVVEMVAALFNMAHRLLSEDRQGPMIIQNVNEGSETTISVMGRMDPGEPGRGQAGIHAELQREPHCVMCLLFPKGDAQGAGEAVIGHPAPGFG